MLHWALVFALVALVAGGLGFFHLAGASASIAKVLLFIFLVLFVIALLGGLRVRTTTTTLGVIRPPTIVGQLNPTTALNATVR